MDKLALFVENAQVIKKEFGFQNSLTKRLAALSCAQEGKLIDCEAIKACQDMIKQNTGTFSTFRGDMGLCIATLLSLSKNPQEIFRDTLTVYDLFKSEGFRASDSLIVAAFQVAAQSQKSDYERVIQRARTFYDSMKAKHFFYTGADDYIFVTMLAITDLDVTASTMRIEKIYDFLKNEFWTKNSVQTLAQLLVLGKSDDAGVDRVLVLRDAFRSEKIKMDKAYTLPILGILALLPVDTNSLIREIDSVQTFLRNQKGFGTFSVTQQELLMFATSMVVSDFADKIKDDMVRAALSTSITSIMIAQQTAMNAMLATTTAAVSSSVSS